MVFLWELFWTGEARKKTALRLISFAFFGLALYLGVQSRVKPRDRVLAGGGGPDESVDDDVAADVGVVTGERSGAGVARDR
jgi:hypothetical protein